MFTRRPRKGSCWGETLVALAPAICALLLVSIVPDSRVAIKKETPSRSLALPIGDRLSELYSRLPFSFELNRGQTEPQVKFLSRNGNYTVFLTSDGAVFSLRGRRDAKRQEIQQSVLSIRFGGAHRKPRVQGIQELPGKTNYFIGSGPQNWITGIPHYARVRYQAVYPGVDVVYYGRNRKLEYDFVVAPGADPGRIRLRLEGADELNLDGSGNLLAKTASGEVVLGSPFIYQETEGARKTVQGGYVRLSRNQFGFHISGYDKRLPLWIDPVVSYSTYLGGSLDEQGKSIAVDSSGNAYIAGSTISDNFPTANAFQRNRSFSTDVFVTKLNAQGSALVYSTYLGGNARDSGLALAVDPAGNAYITGRTVSTNFPTSNAFQAANKAEGGDAFVTKLNAAGSALVFSTYLGGTGDGRFLGEDGDYGDAIAVDSSGNAYVAGTTDSRDFPTRQPFQATHGGGAIAIRDVFVSKFNAQGTLVYSTFLGGSSDEPGKLASFSLGGTGIAVDSSGSAYVAGTTLSSNFPTFKALQSTYKGNEFNGDVFITKFSPTGSTVVYSTFLGGSVGEVLKGIAVDSSGNVLVTGFTPSPDFPVFNAFRSRPEGGFPGDAFVSKIDAAGSSFVYSTFLGGSGFSNGGDQGKAISVDAAGNAYVAGETTAVDFPLASPLQNAYAGPSGLSFDRSNPGDVFVTKFSPTGSILFSTYLGGKSNDFAGGIAVDGSGNVYVTGSTHSTDFPTSRPFQAAFGGTPTTDSRIEGGDAFVAKINTTPGPGEFLPPIPTEPWTRFIRIDSNHNGSPDEQDETVSVQSTKSGQNVLLTFASPRLGTTTVEFSNPHPQSGRFRTATARRQRVGTSLGVPKTRTDVINADRFDSNLRPVSLSISHEAVKGSVTKKFTAAVSLVDANGDGIPEAVNGGITGEPAVTADILFWDVNGDRKADFASGPWSLSSLIRVISSRPQVFVPLGDTNGDGIADSPAFDFDANNQPDPELPLLPAAAGPPLLTEQQLLFAHFGDGEVPGAEVFSQAILMNLNAARSSESKIRIRDDAGRALTTDFNGEMVAGEKDVVIPAAGMRVFKTDGRGPLTTGAISVISNRFLSGVILFGGSVGLAGVGSSEPFGQGFIAPMETNSAQQISTGVAIMNLENRDLTVELRLCDTDGKLLATTRLEGDSILKANGHVAKFLSEFNWNPPVDFSNFIGVLKVKANSKVAATVLQTRPGEFATLPVRHLPVKSLKQGVGQNKIIHFAHFGDGSVPGAQLFSQIMLQNPDPGAAANATVVVLNDAGQLVTVDLNGEMIAGMKTLTIPAGGLRILKTDGQGPITSGSVTVFSTLDLAGVILFGGSLGVAGVGSSVPLVNGFIAPMESNNAEQISTGIAVMNLESVEVILNLQLLDTDGKVIATARLTLPGFGHVARFLGEINWSPSVNFSSFIGILRAVTLGRVAATVLQVRPGRLATLPVAAP